jgi:predicted short-subunit dehydrogenase-like oxidoreductase (DUF2520 family)
MTEISTVAFVGSGKVASVLSDLFFRNNIVISGISSRNTVKGNLLATRLNCAFFDDLSELNADLIIIAVTDDSVKAITDKFDSNQRIAYTAGSIDLQEINHPNCSVFYPLQTFTEGRELQINDIPIFLESKNSENLELIEKLCSTLNFNFDFCNSAQRKQYHLSAVFLNNFVNHLVLLAKDEIDKNHLNWSHLLPLLNETCFKLQNLELHAAQTGPARRNDQSVLTEQKKMLSSYKLEIYEAITKSIIETYKND